VRSGRSELSPEAASIVSDALQNSEIDRQFAYLASIDEEITRLRQ